MSIRPSKGKPFAKRLSDIRGSDLVEIFSVVVFIDDIEDASTAEIDGTFQVYDIAGDPIDFYKPVEGSTFLFPDGTLPLNGAFRCLEGDYWGFKMCLKEKHKNLEICNGRLDLGGSFSSKANSRPLSSVVLGKDGYAIVNFMLFEDAMQATIEISAPELGLEQGFSPAVHGVICARSDSYELENAILEKYFKITLFNASKEKPEKVMVGKTGIPLSRKVVAVPLFSRLIIEAELFNGENKLAAGKVSIPIELSGVSKRKMKGLWVSVYWGF